MRDFQYPQAIGFREGRVQNSADIPNGLWRKRLSVWEIFGNLATRIFEAMNRILNLRRRQLVDASATQVFRQVAAEVLVAF